MKELFYLLLPYWNQKMQLRQSVDYAVLKDGKTIKCAFCDYKSVALGQVKLGKFIFQVPLCGDHFEAYMDKHHERWKVLMPYHFVMNPKLKQ